MNTYYQLVGTNENTGQTIYVSSRNKIHVGLARCKCCGATDTIAHDTLVDICDDCGKVWKAYNTAKGRTSTEKSCKTLYEKIMYLYNMKQKGGKVPEDLMLCKAEVESKLLAYYKPDDPADSVGTEDTEECVCCGAYLGMAMERKEHMCITCGDRLKLYKRYCRRCGVLTLNECFEFYALLHVYLLYAKQGYWAPNVDLMMFKLKKRFKELEEQNAL